MHQLLKSSKCLVSRCISIKVCVMAFQYFERRERESESVYSIANIILTQRRLLLSFPHSWLAERCEFLLLIFGYLSHVFLNYRKSVFADLAI